MRILGKLTSQSIRMMRVRSGFISSSLAIGSLAAFTLIDGPQIESVYLRFALAGTCSTVAVELMTHAIDTVNMRSKVINGSKFYVYGIFKLQGFSQLFTGVQAVIYGYVVSSMLYFYVYAKLKEKFNLTYDKKIKGTGSDEKSSHSLS